MRAVIVLVFFSLLLPGCDAVPPEDSVSVNAQRVNIIADTLTPVDLIETFTLPARIQARDDLVLSSEISGKVVAAHVGEGMRVTRGQQLLEIDSALARAQLEREKQNVAALTRRWERFQRLSKEGLVSRQELDDIDNALTAARAVLEQAGIQYDKSIIESPIDGIVDRRYVDPGEYVDPGRPLLHLVTVDQLEVIADVPEKDVVFLHPGQEVTIVSAVIQGDEDESMTAIIEHIAFVADEASRTYRTRMVIDQPISTLRPGMIVRATFVRREHQQVLVAPLFTILDRRGTKVAYVVEDGYAREVEVTTGSSVGRQLVIRSGLEAGQRLVVKGQQLLIDGAAVSEGDAR